MVKMNDYKGAKDTINSECYLRNEIYFSHFSPFFEKKKILYLRVY